MLRALLVGVEAGWERERRRLAVRDGASCVIVKVTFNLAFHNATEGSNEVIDLAWRSTADRICYANTIDANFVDSRVDGKKIHQVRSK